MARVLRKFSDEELAAMTPAELADYFQPLVGEDIPAALQEKIGQVQPPAWRATLGHGTPPAS